MTLDDDIDAQVKKLKKKRKQDVGEVQDEVPKEKKSKKNKKKSKDDHVDKESEILLKMKGAVNQETNKIESNSEAQTSETVSLSLDELEAKKQRKEKKRLKKLEKKEAKLKEQVKREKNISNKGTTDSVAYQMAVDYLRKWKTDKGNWSFQKVRQVWLLKNMYNEKLVNEDDFKILLEYLEGLKGKSREVTVEEAQVIVTQYDAEDSDSSEEESEKTTSKEKPTEEKYNRARQVIQLL